MLVQDSLDPSLVTWRPPLSLRPAIIKPDRILIFQLHYGRCIPPPTTTVQSGKLKVLFECDCAAAIRFLELTCCPPRHVLERTSSLRSSSNNGRHAQRRGPFRFSPLYSTRWPFGSCRRDRPSSHRRHSIRHGNASTACSSGREGFQRRRQTITGNYKRHAAAGSISNGEDSGRGLFWQGEAGHSSAQWAPGCPQNYFPPQVAL